MIIGNRDTKRSMALVMTMTYQDSCTKEFDGQALMLTKAEHATVNA